MPIEFRCVSAIWDSAALAIRAVGSSNPFNSLEQQRISSFSAPMTSQVYLENDPAAPNITNLELRACAKLFGSGATLSSRGSYCICKAQAYPTAGNAYCRKNPERCSPNTMARRSSRFSHQCRNHRHQKHPFLSSQHQYHLSRT